MSQQLQLRHRTSISPAKLTPATSTGGRHTNIQAQLLESAEQRGRQRLVREEEQSVELLQQGWQQGRPSTSRTATTLSPALLMSRRGSMANTTTPTSITTTPTTTAATTTTTATTPTSSAVSLAAAQREKSRLERELERVAHKLQDVQSKLEAERVAHQQTRSDAAEKMAAKQQELKATQQEVREARLAEHRHQRQAGTATTTCATKQDDTILAELAKARSDLLRSSSTIATLENELNLVRRELASGNNNNNNNNNTQQGTARPTHASGTTTPRSPRQVVFALPAAEAQKQLQADLAQALHDANDLREAKRNLEEEVATLRRLQNRSRTNTTTTTSSSSSSTPTQSDASVVDVEAMARLKAELRAALQRASTAEDDQQPLRARARAAEQAAEQLTKQLALCSTELESLRQHIRREVAAVAETAKEEAAERAHWRDIESQHGGLEARMAELEQTLCNMHACIKERDAAIKKLRGELAEAVADKDAAWVEVAKHTAALAAQRTEMEAEHARQHGAAQRELVKARTELEKLRREVKDANSMLDCKSAELQHVRAEADELRMQQQQQQQQQQLTTPRRAASPSVAAPLADFGFSLLSESCGEAEHIISTPITPRGGVSLMNASFYSTATTTQDGCGGGGLPPPQHRRPSRARSPQKTHRLDLRYFDPTTPNRHDEQEDERGVRSMMMMDAGATSSSSYSGMKGAAGLTSRRASLASCCDAAAPVPSEVLLNSSMLSCTSTNGLRTMPSLSLAAGGGGMSNNNNNNSNMATSMMMMEMVNSGPRDLLFSNCAGRLLARANGRVLERQVFSAGVHDVVSTSAVGALSHTIVAARQRAAMMSSGGGAGGAAAHLYRYALRMEVLPEQLHGGGGVLMGFADRYLPLEAFGRDRNALKYRGCYYIDVTNGRLYAPIMGVQGVELAGWSAAAKKMAGRRGGNNNNNNAFAMGGGVGLQPCSNGRMNTHMNASTMVPSSSSSSSSSLCVCEGDVVACVLDTVSGSISVDWNGIACGTAFASVKLSPSLYPAVEVNANGTTLALV